MIEPHVHFPTNILTISEVENPDIVGIRCKECLIPMPMTQDEWHGFVKWWIFGRGI